MKNARVLALALVLLPASVFASGHHPMAGCGLVYAAGLRDNKTFPQIVGSLFNNFYGTQTFGITSGTSGCTEQGLTAKALEPMVYVELNIQDLRKEIAAGQGEYLAGFANILGVKPEMRETFFALLQANFAAIFSSEDSTPAEMLERVTGVLETRPELLA